MTHCIWNSVVRTAMACGLLVLASAGTALAQGWQTPAGTWDVVLTPQNCTTGVPFNVSFRELTTFDFSGTVISSTAGVMPANKTPGHGTWRLVGRRTFTYSIKFFTFDTATNTVSGWTVIRQTGVIGDDGNGYAAQGGAEIYDAAGTLTGTRCSSITATRFE